MPRGASDSFGDGLYKVLQEVARMKLAPDADLAFLQELEEMIVNRYKSSDATTNVAGDIPAATGTEGMPMPGPGGAPIPVQSVEPLSRGPAPTPDMSGATEELSRIMAGS